MSEITRDGPYLRVLLPDVLPPDWDALRHELGWELDEGVTRVTFVAGDGRPDDDGCPGFASVLASLADEGVETFVVHPVAG
ncbi:MAG: hypothetical protein ACRDHI_07585 [Actinomycetota bacterium]